jgi:hypothetical protein
MVSPALIVYPKDRQQASFSGQPPDLLFIMGPHPDNFDGPDFTDDLVYEAMVDVNPA